ncbi:MAG TPA: 3-deoxy-manno-octulosonate cytidylyltransferase [Chthoniobacterales bacterium]|nr:3-deoxy-manno-octulosonate cytidylyltransferase [Chthoniobacterales bacterium]
MAKALGIIPARWYSSRFPGKPLHLIAGKPLLQHVWERSRRARTLDAVVVATDDIRIAEAAFGWGAEVALTSRAHRSGTDRMAELVAKIRDARFLINIQGDEPLIEPGLIDRIVGVLRDHAKVQMVTAAHPFSETADIRSPHQVKVVLDRNNDALYFSRSVIPFKRTAKVQPRYLRHQGIYGYRRAMLLRLVRWKPTPLEISESLEQLRALENGVKIRVVVTARGSPGVDTLEDVPAVEQQLLAGGKPAVQRRPRRHV